VYKVSIPEFCRITGVPEFQVPAIMVAVWEEKRLEPITELLAEESRACFLLPAPASSSPSPAHPLAQPYIDHHKN
jgi:hypothetical protein